MATRTQQLQIRVTPQQKAALKRRARAAGRDVSGYVLSCALPERPDRFARLLRALQREADHRYQLAELNDFLHTCAPLAFTQEVAVADLGELSPHLQNYVAAMVEQAAQMKEVVPPSWTRDVVALESPWFATSLKSLRIHLLQASPVPFKRRNIFIDAAVGARV